jgi:hypothetical protein
MKISDTNKTHIKCYTIINKIKHSRRSLSVASVKAIGSPRMALDSPNYVGSKRLNALDINQLFGMLDLMAYA